MTDTASTSPLTLTTLATHGDVTFVKAAPTFNSDEPTRRFRITEGSEHLGHNRVEVFVPESGWVEVFTSLVGVDGHPTGVEALAATAYHILHG